jgi:hypothetical protein
VIAERGKPPLSCSECGAPCDDSHSREGWHGVPDEYGWVTWWETEYFCADCWRNLSPSTMAAMKKQAQAYAEWYEWDKQQREGTR